MTRSGPPGCRASCLPPRGSESSAGWPPLLRLSPFRSARPLPSRVAAPPPAPCRRGLWLRQHHDERLRHAGESRHASRSLARGALVALFRLLRPWLWHPPASSRWPPPAPCRRGLWLPLLRRTWLPPPPPLPSLRHRHSRCRLRRRLAGSDRFWP